MRGEESPIPAYTVTGFEGVPHAWGRKRTLRRVCPVRKNGYPCAEERTAESATEEAIHKWFPARGGVT